MLRPRKLVLAIGLLVGVVLPPGTGRAAVPFDPPDELTDLIKVARGTDKDARYKAFNEIARGCFQKYQFRPSEVRPLMLEAIADPDVRVRRCAAFSLQFFGDDARVAPALIAALKDPDLGTLDNWHPVACLAAWSLVGCKKDTKTTVPALVELLKTTQDGRIYSSTVRAIGRLVGEDRKTLSPLVPILLAQVADERRTFTTRRMAAAFQRTIEPDRKEAISVLHSVLKKAKGKKNDEEGLFRGGLIYVLGNYGPAARDAIPEITATLRDTTVHGTFRNFAAEALGKIGVADPDVISALDAVTQETSQRYRVPDAAADALRKLRAQP